VASEPTGALTDGAERAVRAVLTDAEPISATPLGDGVGLLSSLVRVGLRDGRRLIVKAPARDPDAHAIALHFGYYAREAGTYLSLLPRPGVRTPHCYGMTEGPKGPVLVLEDLGALRAGDQLAGASASDAFAAADLLADLHAAFWNDPTLAACSWLPGPPDPTIRGYGHLFALTWDTFRSRVAELVPREHLDAAQRTITHFDDVVERFSAAPRTLVHGDFRLDNVLFRDDPNEPVPSATALDWQLAAWGRGAYDLALFAAGSIATDTRRAIEDDLIERYHARLATNGVDDYTLADCRRDYRRGHVLNLPNPVTALAAVPATNERARQLLEVNACRALAAVADHEGPTG